MPDGMLNPDLPRYLQEASALNALWLKVSLGHFSNNQPLETLRTLLIERGMTLVVENDQTNCGRLAPMQRFEAVCRCAGPRQCSLAGTIGPVADRGPRGVEFPLEGDDLNAVTRHYVNLLRET